MGKKDRALRFVVGTPGGLRASTWKVVVRAGGKSDIYIAPRSMGGSYKVSLHEGGTWQVGFTSDFKRKMVSEGRWTEGSRLTAQFDPPKEIAPGCVLAFRLLVPATAASISSAKESLPTDLVWIPPPPSGRAIEIALILTAPGVESDAWPGRRSMRTALVGTLPLDSGHHLWLVHREDAVPILGTWRGSVSRFLPAPEFSQRLEQGRAIVHVELDGELAASMECKFEDKRFDPKVSV